MIDFFKRLLVCLTLTIGLGDAPCCRCVKMEVESSVFLASLVGRWQGYAIRTPIGKISYDLNFRALETNKVNGTSYTNGLAIHTWIFEYGADGRLLLDFHSTFGDSWAENLCVTQVDEIKGYLFSNGKPSHLQVWINHPVQDKMQIEILLRDQPHVSIVTTRVRS